MEVTLSRLLFYDFEVNRQATIEMLGGYGQPVPNWLSFNPDNRTVYGLANETGAFRLDFVYTDDGGLKAYQNLLITVLPVQSSSTEKAKLPINYFLSCSFVVGLCIFMIYSL